MSKCIKHVNKSTEEQRLGNDYNFEGITMTKIYIIFIALQGAFAQLPGAVNYIVYYSGFLLILALIALFLNFHKVNLYRENVYILFFVLIVAYGIIQSPDLFVGFRQGLRFLSPFIPFLIFTVIIRQREMFLYYLKVNIYALSISVILLNGFIILFIPQAGVSEIHRGMERSSATFAGWHTFGHFCLVTIFLLSLYLLYVNNKKEKYFFYMVYVLGCYLAFKSACRTVYLGLFVFVLIWCLLKKKFLWLLMMMIGVFCLYLYHGNFHALFSEEIGSQQVKIEDLGSGRLGIWMRALKSFASQSLEEKFLGAGPQQIYLEGKKVFGDAHNDYLSILFQYGFIGLVLFLAFYTELFIKAVRLFNTNIGILYIAMLTSIAVMNAVSNSYILRVSVSMIFWPVLLPLLNKDLLSQLIGDITDDKNET